MNFVDFILVALAAIILFFVVGALIHRYSKTKRKVISDHDNPYYEPSPNEGETVTEEVDGPQDRDPVQHEIEKEKSKSERGAE